MQKCVANILRGSIALVRSEYLYRNFGHLCSRVLRNDEGNANSPDCKSSSRSDHGSMGSKENHLDTSSKDWKSYLKTFEQYQYQSDLGQPSSSGPRLLDQPTFNTDFDLWLELVSFRRRQQDINGVRALYNEIIVKDLLIPTTGCTADGLWNNFLYLGCETAEAWEDIMSYARRLKLRTGRSWASFYAKILLHSLKSAPRNAALWHTLLRDHFKPSSEDLKDIFKKAVSSKATLKVFKRIYLDFSFRDMYSTVIPQLCDEGNYKDALRWHDLMFTMNDLPPNVEIAEPLFNHLALHGKTDKLISLTRSMAKAGVRFMTSTNRPLATKRLSISELLNRQLGAIHNISPKSPSDNFCARLFATPAFPINMLLRALPMLGVDEIGPVALRELVLREFKSRETSPSRPIFQCLDKLRKAGISTDDSTFCTVVSNLADQGDERLLEEVINCDMHPDAFEDQKLQEILLAKYHKRGDYRLVSRTLAILTAKCKPESLQSTLMNLILRSALRRKYFTKIHHQLDMMREKRVAVSTESVRAFRKRLLSPRKVSKPPTSVAELPSIIAIYQGILRAGGDVHIRQWREILLRLGMTGSLTDLEKISLWLAGWYSNPSFRASESSFFSEGSKHISEILPIGNPKHPLRILFPAVAQQAIIAWGFQHSRELYRPKKAIRDTGFTWRWGVELLRELKRRNVPILREVLSRACRLRFIALCRDGTSRRLINRTARKLTIDQIIDMAQEIEKIWGSDVFVHQSYRFPPGDPRRFAILKRQVLGKKLNSDATKVPPSDLSERTPIENWSPSSRLEPCCETSGDNQEGRVDNHNFQDHKLRGSNDDQKNE